MTNQGRPQGMSAKKIVFGIAVLAVVGVGVLRLSVWAFGGPAPSLGLRGGRLADCPDSPNCVNSQSSDPRHAIRPLRWTGTAPNAIDRMTKVIQRQPRAKIISSSNNYLRAEFASLLFGFVDDLEVFVDSGEQKIHIRSASRIGYSDLGANRRRVERISRAFLEDFPASEAE